MQDTMQLCINQRQYLEFEKIALGALAPITGFMTEPEFQSVVETMRLPNGAVFPLPVVLDVDEATARTIRGRSTLTLMYDGQEIGSVRPESVYTCDKGAVAERVFGTRDLRHPGVAQFFQMGPWFVGGSVELRRRVLFEFSSFELTPAQTRAYFAQRGWRTVVGFQTRNVPHRAHECLQRLALEEADGLFIQPLVGYKQRGDFHPLAILTAYRTFIENFLPADRVLLGVLSTSMRYAGPREAIFHAIIRRNYGCTHFIIGRDHAGVGHYYGTYEAHQLARHFEDELGIRLLCYRGPFYCQRCEGVVTEQTCPHLAKTPEATRQISGTAVRSMLSSGGQVEPELIRPEVVASLSGLPLFVEEDGEVPGRP